MKDYCKYFLGILFCISLQTMIAQPDYANARKGDQSYQEGRYPDAETSYRKALEVNPKASTAYNLANSMFLQNRIPEAITEYQKAVNGADKPEVKARAFYNMGNAYFQNNEFDQAIKSYKESLKLNPTDEDAKKNLMLAMRQLKQQQQQQQQKQENKQEQQQQEEQKKDQQQQEQQQQQQQQEQQQKQQEEKKDVSKEEANEILKAIEREDQRVQEKLKKAKGATPPPVKDW